jgi:hypothetical protein
VTDAIGPGVFAAVVGASGVGKDALLSYARPRSGARVDALITNDGSLAQAGAQLVRVIRDAARCPAANHQDCVMTAHQAGREVREHPTTLGGINA